METRRTKGGSVGRWIRHSRVACDDKWRQCQYILPSQSRKRGGDNMKGVPPLESHKGGKGIPNLAYGWFCERGGGVFGSAVSS